ILVFEHHWSAPAAMFVALVLAIGVSLTMGAIIVKQKIPSFIITLAGLLVFKGLHWLVIHNATIPVVAGGEENALSLLTTYYVPKGVGWMLAALVTGAVAWGSLRARRQRAGLG